MDLFLIETMGMAPGFVTGGLPLLLFTFAAFCILGFVALVSKAKAQNSGGSVTLSTFSILVLLLGLFAFMVAIVLKIS